MENNKRVKWTYDMLVNLGFTKHKVVVGDAHNYIKGDFRTDDATGLFQYKGKWLPRIEYLDELAGIYFEKTMEYLTLKDCKHESFQTLAKIGRLTEVEGGEVTSYVFEAQIQCLQCGMFFEFVGVPNGSSPSEPMANADFTQLRAPIRPNIGSLSTGLSYKVREEKTDKKNIN